MENFYCELADSGKYIIRVDVYSACSVKSRITYEVLVDDCSMSQTLTESFSPYQADLGGLGVGITRFNTSCMEYLVSGTVSYQTPSSKTNPLGSVVRVVDGLGIVYGLRLMHVEVDAIR